MKTPEEEIHFRGQQAGERVELALRQHPFTLIEHACKAVALVLLGLAIYRLLGSTSMARILSFGLFVGGILVAVRSWYGWWSTMLLLTNERVLFVEQRGFTSRKMSEALLDNIQFVTNEVEGLVHTVLNFGNVKIQTAGAVETLLLRELVDPYEVQQQITRLQRQVSS